MRRFHCHAKPHVSNRPPLFTRAQNGCEFGHFFQTTPEDLIADGLFQALAVAFFAGPHREVSISIYAKTFGAKLSARHHSKQPKNAKSASAAPVAPVEASSAMSKGRLPDGEPSAQAPLSPAPVSQCSKEAASSTRRTLTPTVADASGQPVAPVGSAQAAVESFRLE